MRHGEKPAIDAREQGLRILARIISRKLIRSVGSQKENGQARVSETKVTGGEENHSILQRHHRPCEGDSPKDSSTEKLPDKEKRW